MNHKTAPQVSANMAVAARHSTTIGPPHPKEEATVIE
jgi:hypothetical protein